MSYCYAIHESPIGLKETTLPLQPTHGIDGMTDLLVHLICNITIRIKNVLTFKPHPMVDGVCTGKIFACVLSYLSFPLI